MEIYEADSRINAAAYRTAFRAMGRAFFRRRNRSCPHFTINVLFFRLLLLRVPFADSIVAGLSIDIAQNKCVYSTFLCTLTAISEHTTAQRSNVVVRERWKESRACTRIYHIISSRSRIEASVFHSPIAS